MGIGGSARRRFSGQYLHGYESCGSRCRITFAAPAMGKAPAAACLYRLGAMGDGSIEVARRDSVRYP